MPIKRIREDHVLSPAEIMEHVLANDDTPSPIDSDKLDGRESSDLSTQTQVSDAVTAIEATQSNIVQYLIHKPTILVPNNQSTNVIDNIFASDPYVQINNFIGRHSKTLWQLATSPSFEPGSIVDSKEYNENTLTTWSTNKMLNDTTYYLRCRYESDYHISEWSDTVEFTTGKLVSIRTPTITVDGMPDQVSITPLIIGSTFTTDKGTDTHRKSNWVIKDGTGSVLFQSLNDSINLTSINIPSGHLSYSQSITIELQYIGENSESEWGKITVTTLSAPYIETPDVTVTGYPDNVNIAPGIYGSSYVIHNSNEQHVRTLVEVKDNNGAVVLSDQITPPGLTYYNVPQGILDLNKVYEFRFKYLSDNYASEWGSIIATVSVDLYVVTPTVTIDGIGDGGVIDTTGTIDGGPFVSAGGNLTHSASDWEIYKGATLIWNSLDDHVNLVSIAIPDNTLEYDQTYEVRCVYKATNGLRSNTGISTFIVRKQPKVEKPIITYPTNGDTTVEPLPTLTIVDNGGKPVMVNDPNTTIDDNDTATYKTVHWALLPGTELVSNGPSITPPQDLVLGQTYTLKVKIVPNEPDVLESEWSDIISFTVDSNFTVNDPGIDVTGISYDSATITATYNGVTPNIAGATHIKTLFEILLNSNPVDSFEGTPGNDLLSHKFVGLDRGESYEARVTIYVEVNGANETASNPVTKNFTTDSSIGTWDTLNGGVARAAMGFATIGNDHIVMIGGITRQDASSPDVPVSTVTVKKGTNTGTLTNGSIVIPNLPKATQRGCAASNQQSTPGNTTILYHVGIWNINNEWNSSNKFYVYRANSNSGSWTLLKGFDDPANPLSLPIPLHSSRMIYVGNDTFLMVGGRGRTDADGANGNTINNVFAIKIFVSGNDITGKVYTVTPLPLSNGVNHVSLSIVNQGSNQYLYVLGGKTITNGVTSSNSTAFKLDVTGFNVDIASHLSRQWSTVGASGTFNIAGANAGWAVNDISDTAITYCAGTNQTTMTDIVQSLILNPLEWDAAYHPDMPKGIGNHVGWRWIPSTGDYYYFFMIGGYNDGVDGCNPDIFRLKLPK